MSPVLLLEGITLADPLAEFLADTLAELMFELVWGRSLKDFELWVPLARAEFNCD